MKAIILAAGRGTRIPSITKKKPKCLIKVNKIPILLRQINFLRKLNALMENYQFILSELKSRVEYVDIRYKDGFVVKKLDEKLYKTNKEKKTAL